MPWTTPTINAVLNGTFRNLAYVGLPTVTFGGLLKAAPNLDGVTGIQEINGGATNGVDMNGYNRIQLNTILGAAAGRAVSNTAALLFSSSVTLGSGGVNFNITHFGVFSASSGGSLMAFGALASPFNVGTGSLINIPIGQLQIRDPDV